MDEKGREGGRGEEEEGRGGGRERERERVMAQLFYAVMYLDICIGQVRGIQ